MFYIDQTTEKWIESVIQSMNEKQLKPENSRFMIALFSSMDSEFVKYFKDNKEQISSFSGKNFHIFTPIIYKNNLIPDDKWRLLKKEFNERGIPVNTDPVLIFFNLKKENNEFVPYFFAGYNVDFDNFNNQLKKAINSAIEITDNKQLTSVLNKIFLTKNIISDTLINNNYKSFISSRINKPTVFISHSSKDKPFVHKLINALPNIKSKFWIDEKEIKVGDNIKNVIVDNIKSSDFVLLIVSKNSIKSDWVKFELSQFIADSKKIIPIILDKKQDFPEPFNNELKTIKYLDFSKQDNWEKNLKELYDVLNR